MDSQVIWFSKLGKNDINQVGGKNASLGEMISNLHSAGVNVPNGFATTATAFNEFLKHKQLEEKIQQQLDQLDVQNLVELARTGKVIRTAILEAPLPPNLEKSIRDYYQELGGGADIPVAVRSSATAEDLPDASFAGQQETFLNIRGIDAVLEAVKHVFASLYNDRAISYRVHQGYDQQPIALSAGIQHMVNASAGSSGVMFTLDTESGFKEVVFVTASYGLGELVVQGAVNPDEFYLYKPALREDKPAILRRNLGSKAVKLVFTDDGRAGKSVKSVDVPSEQRLGFALNDTDATKLAQQGLLIEQHYGMPMDIEWAKDGESGELFVLQARPETVKSRATGAVIERYMLKDQGELLVEGRAIGQRIGAGPVKVIDSIANMDQIQPGDVLVTDMTDPDWEPIMKRSAAIITNRGGRTCHAAIIARELGIPAVVGCMDATKRLKDVESVTVTCAQGDVGAVYKGELTFDIQQNSVDSMPSLPFEVMMNVGNPDRAFDFASLPNAGIGLARLEFIINRMIGVHPKALLNFEQLPRDIKSAVERRIAGYASPIDFYIEKLVEGIATLAAAFAPKPVIVRLSDFKSNEYANLIGGRLYEPDEENPMLGFRGASRYISDSFRDCFELECRALKKVREVMGFKNVKLMVPFVRTEREAEQVIHLLAENGLKRGDDGLEVIMMCELPTNALLADDFLKHFDGFSIGSNDLTQLTLGLDRDSGIIAHLFDERDPAVRKLLKMAIQACKAQGKYVGICGQGPSDHPDFAQWLMQEGIDSVSLNPDSVMETWFFLSESIEK